MSGFVSTNPTLRPSIDGQLSARPDSPSGNAKPSSRFGTEMRGHREATRRQDLRQAKAVQFKQITGRTVRRQLAGTPKQAVVKAPRILVDSGWLGNVFRRRH